MTKMRSPIDLFGDLEGTALFRIKGIQHKYVDFSLEYHIFKNLSFYSGLSCAIFNEKFVVKFK